MAATEEMVRFARDVRPHDCCLVPEKRAEVTTEGGLDVAGQVARLRDCCAALREAGIRVSLFIDPDPAQLDAAARPVRRSWSCTPAPMPRRRASTRRGSSCVVTAARHGAQIGLTVHAGHGLHYHNVQPVAAMPEIVELNIGHAIVARAVIDGFAAAVRKCAPHDAGRAACRRRQVEALT